MGIFLYNFFFVFNYPAFYEFIDVNTGVIRNKFLLAFDLTSTLYYVKFY